MMHYFKFLGRRQNHYLSTKSVDKIKVSDIDNYRPIFVIDILRLRSDKMD